MKQTHLYTSDQKLQIFGYGEWVEEPDLVEFTHNGVDCKIMRHSNGFLCGYIKLHNGCEYVDKSFEDIPIEAHGELTYSSQLGDGFWIGFDCAHFNDCIPGPPLSIVPDDCSNELKICIECLNEIILKLKSTRDQETTYKNTTFCIEQCKSMADQFLALEANVKHE